ncbi:unnamed protein product [Meloidogyne enterolobii]|uniref:Uncharacterized protein n=1 Tax=Meloidogyne enterolobii TaxID=390850 RepID=A0ACB0XN82_MELEN
MPISRSGQNVTQPKILQIVTKLIFHFQHYRVGTETLHIDNLILPVREFKCSDPTDETFGREIIKALECLGQFKLTTTETALLSAYVLLEQSNGTEDFVAQIKNCLSAQLHSRLSSDVDNFLNDLMGFLPKIRSLAMLHLQCFGRFKRQIMQLMEVKMEMDDNDEYVENGQQMNNVKILIFLRGHFVEGLFVV